MLSAKGDKLVKFSNELCFYHFDDEYRLEIALIGLFRFICLWMIPLRATTNTQVLDYDPNQFNLGLIVRFKMFYYPFDMCGHVRTLCIVYCLLPYKCSNNTYMYDEHGPNDLPLVWWLTAILNFFRLCLFQSCLVKLYSDLIIYRLPHNLNKIWTIQLDANGLNSDRILHIQ